MISVVIPALNAEARLAACLEALVTPALDGLIKEVIVVDGGSADNTAEIADGFGATVLTAPPGRGGQLRAGAAAVRGDWLLFLHADTVLEEGWGGEAAAFMNGQPERAGVFTLRFDAKGLAPRFVAAGAMARTRLLKAPYGDQGLLIARQTYDAIGGYADMPLMEDVEIIARLLRLKDQRVLHIFKAKAITSPVRYEHDGYLRRVIKNGVILMRYQLGASPEKLAKAYR